jgi:hypothetical protein
MPEELIVQLRTLAVAGVLPRWSDWFGPGVIDTLLPDTERRDAVLETLPEVPVSYFEAHVPLPEGWSAAANGTYILLSDTYRPAAREAASRGWPVIESLGGHLDIVTRAGDLARTLGGLARG